jgi:hypothetical protein
MATVTSLTADRIMELVNSLIKSGTIDVSGNIILTKYDNTTINIGSVPTDAVTSAELTSALASYVLTSALTTALASYMTTSASSAKTNTLLKTGSINGSNHLILTKDDNSTVDVGLLATQGIINYLYNGSSYATAPTAGLYVGTADPGSVPNGSVWFDTT